MKEIYTIELNNGQRLELGRRTLVVGVLNVTPDSFSDGGRNYDAARAVDRAVEMESEGADIIEVGGESTRPGATPVAARDEIARIEPVISGLSGRITIPIAVDTYKSDVAAEAMRLGAAIINDVSALRFDPALADVAARHEAALVLMHMRGDPATMQVMEPSPDIFAEIESDLRKALSEAKRKGVNSERIIIDPGIGFGKTLEQNLNILNNLDRFNSLDLPIMVGTSRKSFIGRLTGREADERIFGTAASVAVAITRGAHIVRVHDVKEMVEVARITDAILGAN
jgi:dihydropteroate synthase